MYINPIVAGFIIGVALTVVSEISVICLIAYRSSKKGDDKKCSTK